MGGLTVDVHSREGCVPPTGESLRVSDSKVSGGTKKTSAVLPMTPINMSSHTTSTKLPSAPPALPEDLTTTARAPRPVKLYRRQQQQQQMNGCLVYVTYPMRQ